METSSVSRLRGPRFPTRRDSETVKYNPDFDQIARDALQAMIKNLVQQVLGRERPYSLEIRDPRSNFFNGWARLRGQTVDLQGRCASAPTNIPDSEVLDPDPYFGTSKHGPREHDAMHKKAIRRTINRVRLIDLPLAREDAHPFFAMMMTENHGQYPFRYTLGLVEPLAGTPSELNFLLKFGDASSPHSTEHSHIVWMPHSGWDSSAYAKPFVGSEELSVVEAPELRGKIQSFKGLLKEINQKIQFATRRRG